MSAQLLIVLWLAAMVAGCAEAGLVPNKGADYPSRMPIEGFGPAASLYASEPQDFYEDVHLGRAPQMPPMPSMGQQKQQPPNSQFQGAANPARRIANHLRQLGKTGLDSTRRAYQDAKPALSDIRGDLGEIGQRVMMDPRVQKVASVVGPQLTSGRQRAQPLLERGKRLVERARARRGHRHQLQGLEPGSVHPVPPANAAL